MKTTLETAILSNYKSGSGFAAWFCNRTHLADIDETVWENLKRDFLSGKLIILRTGGEVRIRSVD